VGPEVVEGGEAMSVETIKAWAPIGAFRDDNAVVQVTFFKDTPLQEAADILYDLARELEDSNIEEVQGAGDR
jgi:hypothetical protein